VPAGAKRIHREARCSGTPAVDRRSVRRMRTMTSLPPWAADPGSLTLTEAQYDALPDWVRKLIEVIDGNVIFCPGGTPEHAELTRTLAIRLDAARPAQPCTRVYTGADVHFTKRRRSDGTLSFRRPDISVSRCTDKDARLFGTCLWSWRSSHQPLATPIPSTSSRNTPTR
jgi:hypothetical protein